ncbi:hypothetical protein O6H91_20G001300 [Diphasiastrum complanatum]|uniref:Uncharacterized protein n=1 Tax=Diphasiastrum complanatum TaxID=34168 RepID=A0ACC2AM62_DIPCM|nr:hypothetical protein O6H91_20G001300 [Diphasiastrum complanatum]
MKLEKRRCSLAQAALYLLQLLLIMITQSFKNSHEQIVESLPLGSVLQPNQTVVSRNGSFALVFFPLGRDRNYLGVSYATIPNRTPIWVANRNKPAKDGASLKFSVDDDLVISNPDQTIVWTRGTSGRNISSMLMEESGNLILYHNSGRTIWQGFDHPTDTWMPGMKVYLGSKFLTASKSLIDLAEGRYVLWVRQTGEFVDIWNATTDYARTGLWNGQIFANLPDMTSNLRYMTFSIVNDSGRPYYIVHEKQKLLLHATLEYDGVYRVRTWDSSNAMWHIIALIPKNPCQVDQLCGQNGICNNDCIPFCSCPQGFKPVDPIGWNEGDWSLGCVANLTLDCRSKTFSPLQQTYYDQGTGAGSARSYSGHDQAWCQASCTSDCACLGFSFNGGSSNCSLHHGPFFNGRSSPEIGQNFFLRVNSSEQIQNNQLLLLNDGKKKGTTARITGLIVAFGFALMIAIGFIIWKFFRRKRTEEKQCRWVWICVQRLPSRSNYGCSKEAPQS